MMRQEFAYGAWGEGKAGSATPKGPAERRRDSGGHRRVILTADDFGRSSEINRAVARAHREGLLTCASLMISGEAAEEAVAIAREMPTLAVGLHLVVVDGRSILPPERIGRLVNERGEFPKDVVRAGIGYALSRATRRQLAREVRAQFEKFAESGLPLSHVDGHLHMHAHPAVLEIMLPLAEEFGAAGIRAPRESLIEAVMAPSKGRATKLARSLSVGWIGRRCARLVRRRGCRLATVDRVIGLSESGHMTEDYVIAALSRLRGQTAEFFFHPTEGDRLDELGPNPGDLAALLSRRVAQAMKEQGLQKATYETILADTMDGVEAT